MVGYRYSALEISVLMSLQGAGAIPCLPRVPFPSHEEFISGLQSLEEGGVLTQAGGRVLLDKVHALLISSLCACDTFIAVSDEERCAALCRCEKLCLLAKLDKQRAVLRAAPSLEDFEALFWETLSLFPGKTEIRLSLPGEKSPPETLLGEALAARAREMMRKLPS